MGATREINMVAELSSIDFSSCVGVSIYNVKLLTFDQQNVVLNKFQYAIYNVLVSCLAGNDYETDKQNGFISKSKCLQNSAAAVYAFCFWQGFASLLIKTTYKSVQEK